LSEQCAHQSPRQYALTYHAKSPITFQPGYRSRNLSSYQTTSAPPPPPSHPTTPDAPHSPWTHRPPSTLRPAPSPLQAFFSKLSSNFVV
jgi:hypothetical protein